MQQTQTEVAVAEEEQQYEDEYDDEVPSQYDEDIDEIPDVEDRISEPRTSRGSQQSQQSMTQSQMTGPPAAEKSFVSVHFDPPTGEGQEEGEVQQTIVNLEIEEEQFREPATPYRHRETAVRWLTPAILAEDSHIPPPTNLANCSMAGNMRGHFIGGNMNRPIGGGITDNRIRKHFYSPTFDEIDLTTCTDYHDPASPSTAAMLSSHEMMSSEHMMSSREMINREMTQESIREELTSVFIELHLPGPNQPESWLTNEAGTPGSKESHASFWNDLVEELPEEEPYQKLCEFEDFTKEKLHAPISGNWTRRFVQKRTKPKMINQMMRERIDCLIKLIENDRISWRLREIIYINLALRVRLHAEIADGWVEFMEKTYEFAYQAEDTLKPKIIEFQQLVESYETDECPKPYLMLSRALDQIVKPLYDHCLPPVEKIRELHVNLVNGKDRMQGPMWDTHDHFYAIDEQVDRELFETLKRYSDFAQNPLIRQETKNFRECMNQIHTMHRAANYCRRNLQALIPVLLPDFAMIEVTATTLLLHSFREWILYMMSQWRFDQDAAKVLEDKILCECENADGDKENVLDLESVQRGGVEMAEFVKDELAEVQRLIVAQIECEGAIVIIDLLKVVQHGPYAPTIPTGVPLNLENAIEMQRERLYRERDAEVGDPEVEAEMADYMDRVANRVNAHGLLLNQGLLYLFESCDSACTKCLLCIQIAALDNVHVDGRFLILRHSEFEDVVLEFSDEDAVKQWLPFVAKFCR